MYNLLLADLLFVTNRIRIVPLCGPFIHISHSTCPCSDFATCWDEYNNYEKKYKNNTHCICN